MSSQVDIANLALDMIGTRSSISSLTEGSAESNAVARQWDNAVDSVLRSAHWNFARRQLALTLIADATQSQTVPTPWLYEYSYPSDCLLARFVMPTVQSAVPSVGAGVPSQVTAFGSPVKFIVGADFDSGQNAFPVILTNQPQATLVYTFRNQNYSMWDSKATDCLSAFLAAGICMALTGDKNMKKMALEIANQAARDAQASNGNEGLTVIDNVPESIRVRGYASDYAYPDGGLFTYGPQALTMLN